jgi:trk system potassium uptake protein TrkA
MDGSSTAPKKGRLLAKKRDTAVLVIGLGRFGSAAAKQLVALDTEVLAVDTNMQLVQQFSDELTHTVQADVTTKEALTQIGAGEFGSAIVAVGSSIEASVLITANLVDLGVPQIWTKAVSSEHGRILERIGASHVIYPEAEAGERVAHLLSGRMLDFVQIDADFAIVRMLPPKVLQGKTLGEAHIRDTYKVTAVGVKKPGATFTYATTDSLIDAADEILVSGQVADIERFAALPKV